MPDDEEDPHAYDESWAGYFDRLLYGIGWLIGILFVTYTGFYLLGVSYETSFKIALRLTMASSVGVLMYHLRS